MRIHHPLDLFCAASRSSLEVGASRMLVLELLVLSAPPSLPPPSLPSPLSPPPSPKLLLAPPDPSPPPSLPPPLLSPSLALPPHESHRTSFDYSFHATPRNWSTADALCRDSGGSLASVTSAAENALVLRLCTSACWVGLNDVKREGQWTWTTGPSASGYKNWAPGEPNGQLHEATDAAYLYPPGHALAGLW